MKHVLAIMALAATATVGLVAAGCGAFASWAGLLLSYHLDLAAAAGVEEHVGQDG